MNECIIPLTWDQMNSMAEVVEQRLTRQGGPTILSLRTQLVLEVCFSAARSSPGADAARMRCCFTEPQTLVVQCKSSQPDFLPNWDDLWTLDNAACTYGLKLTKIEDGCQILIGQR